MQHSSQLRQQPLARDCVSASRHSQRAAPNTGKRAPPPAARDKRRAEDIHTGGEQGRGFVARGGKRRRIPTRTQIGQVSGRHMAEAHVNQEECCNGKAIGAKQRVSASCTLGGHLDAPQHLRHILGSMLNDPQLGGLFDVVLVVGEEKFPAHRAVLAAVSRVFKAMFTNDMKEKNQCEIHLTSLDPKAWRMAMQYIYHAQLDIDSVDSALSLLTSARMYQLDKLQVFVEEFLCSSVKLINCFVLLAEAERYHLSSLEKACYQLMAKHFVALIASPAFLSCPFKVLQQLVSCSDLMVKSEMCVFLAITRWIGFNECQRLPYLERLLNMIKLELLTEEELREVGRNIIARKCISFKEEIFERLIYWCHDLNSERLLKQASHLRQHRRDCRLFTFSYVQYGLTNHCPQDDEEVLRTPWHRDFKGGHLWRLKIYPNGYNKAKGQCLSIYLQGKTDNHGNKMHINAKFDIFLINRKECAETVLFSSQHEFCQTSDHWGFHRFIPLSTLTNPQQGYWDPHSDSLLLGANLYFDQHPQSPSPISSSSSSSSTS